MQQPVGSQPPRVAIVGGGLAGLAAAAALTTHGCRVELLEARRKLGGRAGSYIDRETGESIDHCQHVAMGCCTNFLDFCRRTRTEDLFTRHRTLHFFGPDGRRSDFTPGRWLPAPLHLARGLMSLDYLSLRDKAGIARGMLSLLRTPPRDVEGSPTVQEWLAQQHQSPAAIERFWKVVLISALAESLDRASLAAARKVFVDGFLAHRDAANLIVPRVSLGELYDQRVAGWLREHGATIHLETPVEAVAADSTRLSGLQLAGGSIKPFDLLILAVPWQRVAKMLSPPVLAAVDPAGALASIASAPISGVHLWLNRAITELPHAVLVGRLSQWIFARRLQQAGEHYYQVVISASHDLASRDRQSIVDEVMDDLGAMFPTAREARLIRWQLISEPHAVFSVRPGLDRVRPRQQTAVGNLLLAGDWTSTGWPATMEGAVRSGYLAAEGVLARLGRRETIVVPDLARNWLLRGFSF